MVWCNFKTEYFTIQLLSLLMKKLLQSGANFFDENWFSLFWAPDEMVVHEVDWGLWSNVSMRHVPNTCFEISIRYWVGIYAPSYFTWRPKSSHHWSMWAFCATACNTCGARALFCLIEALFLFCSITWFEWRFYDDLCFHVEMIQGIKSTFVWQQTLSCQNKP